MNIRNAYIALALAGMLVCSCSVEKYLPEGAYALKSNKVIVTNSDVKPNELLPYVKQQGQATSLAIKNQKNNVIVFNPKKGRGEQE